MTLGHLRLLAGDFERPSWGGFALSPPSPLFPWTCLCWKEFTEDPRISQHPSTCVVYMNQSQNYRTALELDIEK